MPCRSILLPIRESDVADSLIESAAGIARRQRAHLTALYVHPHSRAMTPYATLGLTRAMRDAISDAASAESREQACRLRDAFERRCRDAGLAIGPREVTSGQTGAEFVEREGVRSELIARLGRLANLIVVPRPNRTAPPPSSFEAAVRETGRPVLMIPRGAIPESIGRTVAIGWNGSKEAARAVATAIPYLHGSTVHVLVSVKRTHEDPTADDLVAYLGGHGVAAQTRVFDVRGAEVGATLLRESTAVGADLLVVGGYSRSRLREVVMGGVTGYLLEHVSIPTLIVH